MQGGAKKWGLFVFTVCNFRSIDQIGAIANLAQINVISFLTQTLFTIH